MSNARKIITATIAALTLGATIAVSATPAEARYGRNAAFFGGLAVGALALGALGATAYASPGYAYGGCFIERRPVMNAWGDVVGVRRVRVCQ